MAAVVVSADGGVAPLDSDSASPRIPSPAPEQTLQNKRAAGTPDRGDREHTQLPDLRRDQPAATGEKTTRLSASPLASRGASCLVITVF